MASSSAAAAATTGPAAWPNIVRPNLLRSAGAGARSSTPRGVSNRHESPDPSGNRHGSDERRERSPRPRENRATSTSVHSSPYRERARAHQATSTSPFRSNPAGPEEHLDWLEALDNLRNKYDTMERNQIRTAEVIARLDTRVTELHDRTNGLANTAERSERHLCEACENILSRYSTAAEVSTLTTVLENRVDVIDRLLETLVNGQRPPQTYNVGTPLQTAAPPGVPQNNDRFMDSGGDPWNRQAR